MADNVDITAGTGTAIATDQVSGTLEHVQLTKLAISTDGSRTLVPADGTNGLTVDLGSNNDVTVTGSVTANAGTNLNTSLLALESGGNLASLLTSSQLIDDSIHADDATRSKSILIGACFDDTSPTAITENQAGYLRMSSRRALLVEGVASGTAIGIQDGGNSITVDSPVGTPTFVRLSDGASAISTLPVSLASVPSHAVTNAGTFAVQASLTAPVSGSGSLTAQEQAVTLTLAGEANATFQLTGTWSATITFEASNDNSNWTTIYGMKAGDNIIATTATTNDIYRCTVAGFGYVRARCSAYTSGTVVVTAKANPTPSGVFLNFPLPAGSNSIGILGANSGVDIGDVTINNSTGGSAVNIQDGGNAISVDWNGTTPVTGSGTATGALRVELPTNGTGTVAINNASGASAVNIQDGGNAISVDWAGTAPVTGSGNATGALRVELANNGTGLVGLNAGSNTVGNVGLVPSTSGGLSVANFTGGDGAGGVLTNAAQVIKASAGQLYGWYLYNPNTTAIYVIVYNIAAASVTVGTSNSTMVFCVPALGAANAFSEMGITFSNAGWSAAAATTAGGNGAPTTGLECMFFYK